MNASPAGPPDANDLPVAIDRSSVLPYYHQLKQILLGRLRRDGLQPGDRIPGDQELCGAYGVSRTVVRQALAELETEGVIERIKGRGTFVAQPRTAQALVQSLTGLYEDIAARGKHLRSDVRRLEVAPADARVAAELGLEVEHPITIVERLRYVDDEPWVFTVSYLPAEIAPDLASHDLTNQSLYAVLERAYGVVLARATRSAEASTAGEELAQDLHVEPGAPILMLRSVSYGDAGRPLEMFIAFHRGDRSRFEVELARHPRASASGPVMRLAEH